MVTETRYSAAWLKELRDRLGMTQAEIAQEIGCARNTWSRWEIGETSPLPVYRPLLDRLAERAQFA